MQFYTLNSICKNLNGQQHRMIDKNQWIGTSWKHIKSSILWPCEIVLAYWGSSFISPLIVVNTLLPGPVHYPHHNESRKSSIGDVTRMAAKKNTGEFYIKFLYSTTVFMVPHHRRLLLICPPHRMNFTRLLQHGALGPHHLSTNQIEQWEDMWQNAKLVKALTSMTRH